MKRNGQPVIERRPVPIVFASSKVELYAAAVPSYEPFNAVIKVPTATLFTEKDGSKTYDTESDDYIKKVDAYNTKKTAWTIMTSLLAGTPDLTFEHLKLEDPTTWDFSEEVKKSGFSPLEEHEIMRRVMEANGLDEIAMNEARKSFLQSGRVDTRP